MRSASSGTTGSYRNAWQLESVRIIQKDLSPARRRSAVSRVFYREEGTGDNLMSYDIRLKDPVTDETLDLPVKHVMTGGTYQADYDEQTRTFSPKPISDLALIKVYVSLWDISKLSKVFCETVRLLLAYSDNRFHAKVSRVKRKDSMCFWVSRHAFHILESHFSECSDVIGGAMPFIAYRGRLGISRELATFDSHNSEQALLISSSI